VKYRNNSSRLISGNPRRRSNSSSANTRVATNPNLQHADQPSSVAKPSTNHPVPHPERENRSLPANYAISARNSADDTTATPIFTDRGIVGAIRALAADSGLDVGIEVADEVPAAERAPAAVEAAAYFVVAEALTNAAKHSRAARTTHAELPGLPVLVLSQYVEESYATELLGTGTSGLGYLLKDRVGRVDEFLDAMERVAAGWWRTSTTHKGRGFQRRTGRMIAEGWSGP
jgi:hypothetical protein